MLLTEGMVNRWAASDGPVSMEVGSAESVEVTCGDASQAATVENGIASLSASQAAALMPSAGVFDLDFGGIASATVERVGARYCTPDDVIAYGERNGDGFGNAARYPVDAIRAAIQAAEEAIEAGTRRSFCERAVEVAVAPGLNELPVEDARSASTGTLLHGRQLRSDEEADVTVVYGARLDRQVRGACVQLAASYLRPRVGAENVRGQSMDGVYVSYTLATGEEGGETGLPEVDAVIASHRSHRSVVM